MCGIAGFIEYTPRQLGDGATVLNDMTDALTHRGPDSRGVWLDPEHRIGLGHRRLSIIDRSDMGSQPMQSASGRYSVIFNGEIYGFLELREELLALGETFAGKSDTEVLLAAVERFGLAKALEKCNGMFAFALFDAKERTVSFARDRIGKKPLYIGLSGSSVAFASELKSIRRHPAFVDATLNLRSLASYLRYRYVPTPHTIYNEVFKLHAGSTLTLSAGRCPKSLSELQSAVIRYWDCQEVVARAANDRIVDEAVALGSLEDVLRKAVGDRMVSDVGVGAFLSGGVDSSLVAAVMQELSTAPIRTFTVSFLESAFNEADNALKIAEFLRTDHTEITATPQMALDVVGDLAEVYDEPFADPSQIPTLIVSRLARQHVSVALSGDGGDELFGGYARYLQMQHIERLARNIPSLAFRAIAAAPVGLVDKAVQVGKRLSKNVGNEVTGDRVKKLAELALVGDFDDRYLHFMSEWKDPARVVIGEHEPFNSTPSRQFPASANLAERMMLHDTMAYLPDDVLVKVDRASMSVALELRAPLLDYRLIETAWKAPRSLCLSDKHGKVALRRLLARRLPKRLIDLPKRGFGVPLNEWLRSQLRPLAEDLLSSVRLQNDGLFHPAIVRSRWEEHLSGRRNWGSQLWTIIMFNAWRSRWM